MSYKSSNVIGCIAGLIVLIATNIIITLICTILFANLPILTRPIFNRYLDDFFTWSSVIYWLSQLLSGFVGGKACYMICKEKYSTQHKPGCIVLEIIVVVLSIISVVLSVINQTFSWNIIVASIAVCGALLLACNGYSLDEIFD